MSHNSILKGVEAPEKACENRKKVSRIPLFIPLSKLAPLRQRPHAAALPPEVKKANGKKF